MRNQNNFDNLRIIAAVAVVFSHSIPLSYGSDDLEPLWRLSRHQTTLGSIAVCVFFVISGYLITQSFHRSRNPKTFLLARALRLMPGLAVVLVILAFVIGPIISNLKTSDYFTSVQPYQFFIVNLTLLDSFYHLPGVFLNNPFHGAVNGSLWTLPHEARCYIIVLCLGVCGILNRFTSLGIWLVGCIQTKFQIGGDQIMFISYFFAGSALYHWQLPLRRSIAILCALMSLVALFFGGFRIACASVGAYLIIYIGLAPRIRMPDFARWGDLSYGTYIWAFPVQQITSASLGAWASWYFNLAISLPIVLALAWMSWHFVEAPALSLKKLQQPRFP